MAFALVGGMILAVARMSRSGPLPRAAVMYIEFVRNTPLLIQLFFLFYVMPSFGIKMGSLATGILALGLHYSTYLAEVYRSGIEGVPRGQWEAAVALNLSPFHTWTRVILPQAIPPIVPVLGNYFIGMFKDTPLLATITVRELLGTALNEAARTFRYMEPISLVGAIFFVLSYPSALLIRRLEVRLALRRR